LSVAEGMKDERYANVGAGLRPARWEFASYDSYLGDICRGEAPPHPEIYMLCRPSAADTKNKTQLYERRLR
jgi:hypothetical protein